MKSILTTIWRKYMSDEKEKNITGEDAQSILNFADNFNTPVDPEDRKYLESIKDKGSLTEDETKKLKVIMMKYLLSGQDVFNDPLWEQPKKSAAEMMKELDEESDA